MTTTVDFESYRQEWLNDVKLGNPSTTELGHRFARKILTQWRDIDDSSDDLVYCDGAGDGGHRHRVPVLPPVLHGLHVE